ncbi:unnamed protein product [Symbiodinium natans]|uniref:EF-hand domain-containing protein n=1 Tax=Symbiodinium natans TaxID=878477 RepID=A0A812P0H1_9DINO|nr:unnamed protein product [Symbiodinium natans]
MGSGASLQDATPAQIKETFGTLSEEDGQALHEQKKITEALSKVEAKVEAAAPATGEAPAAPAAGEPPAEEAPPGAVVKKEDAPAAEESPMSDEQLSMLKAAFDDIDTNGSKFIEASELKTVLGKMKVDLSEDQIDAVFKRADINKDGKLSFDEYKKLVCAGMSVTK